MPRFRFRPEVKVNRKLRRQPRIPRILSLVAAGGTLAKLIFRMLFGVAARAIKYSGYWRYFFWMPMTFNLFDAGGYFLFSGIANIGDWAGPGCGMAAAWAWRMGLAALGIVTYFLVVPLSLRELRPQSGGAVVDFDCSCIIWWQRRAGMDVEPALWSAHPEANSRCPRSTAAGDRSLLP